MINQHFEVLTFPNFIISEFRNKNVSTGFVVKLKSLISLIPSSIYNYHIKQNWIELYNSLEHKFLNFHPDINCERKGAKPNIIQKIVNLNKKRIEFRFNKCHIGITNDSLYFFPYETADWDRPFFDTLEKPFRIIYNPKAKKDKYSNIDTISNMRSIREINGRTEFSFQLKILKDESTLRINKELNLPNLSDKLYQ